MDHVLECTSIDLVIIGEYQFVSRIKLGLGLVGLRVALDLVRFVITFGLDRLLLLRRHNLVESSVEVDGQRVLLLGLVGYITVGHVIDPGELS